MLIESLIEVDIERVWMEWRTKISKQPQDHSAADWLGQLLVVPRLVDYVTAISKHSIDFSVTESLLRTEYRARQEWGDAPRWDIALSAWPNLPKLPGKPARHRVEVRSKEFPFPRAFDLCDSTEFGRQRTNDDQFGVIVHADCGSRTINAPRTNDTISRRQFKVQILSANHAILTNLSQTNSLPIGTTKTLAFEECLGYSFAICTALSRPEFALHLILGFPFSGLVGVCPMRLGLYEQLFDINWKDAR